MSIQDKFSAAGSTRSAFSQFVFIGKGEFTKLLYSPLQEQKAGAVQIGQIDLSRGPLRLIEVDEYGHATGWQAETVMGAQNRNAQCRPLDKITQKFWEAAGYEHKQQMIDEILSSAQNMGHKVTPKSLATAVIFAPLTPEKIVYRSQEF